MSTSAAASAEAYKEVIAKAFPGIFSHGKVSRSKPGKWNCELREAFNETNLTELWSKLQEDLNQAIDSGVALGQVELGSEEVSLEVRSVENSGGVATAFSLPVKRSEAIALYAALDPSLVGVEKRGDVLDDKLRSSHEAKASRLTLPARLRTFDFPEEVERIKMRLCPSAESVRIEAYKFIVYGKGDFFVPHRDSMDRADMLGSVSLMLPMEADAADGAPDESASEESGLRRFQGERVGHPGQLVLYVGYHAGDPTQEALCGRMEQHPANPLTYTVDMEKLVVPESAAVPADGKIKVNYGAWSGDVLHEVRKVDKGYRAVIIYRIYKEGHRADFVPPSLRSSVAAQVSAVMQLLKAGSPRAGENPGVKYQLGFTLRHVYPPAGLLPSALKGIDAVLYSIASEHYQCYLFNGYEARFKDFNDIHSFSTTPFEKTIFYTTENLSINFYDEEAYDEMIEAYPIIRHTIWVQLGYGALLGGGFCYGNVDCGTDWWYRQAYLLVGEK